MAERAAAGPGGSRGPRFALAKFRPPALPATLVTRPGLHNRLTAGAGQRLTVVAGSAGAGKSVLLSSWAAARPGATSWLSCDEADASPVRFWAGFLEAPRVIEPGFGADAAGLLAMDGAMSADVTASIANDAAQLPAGSALIVDDFDAAAAAVSADMADLVGRWPAGAAQLVLAGRADPPVRLHRLRLAGELCELRDRDLSFSLAESGDLASRSARRTWRCCISAARVGRGAADGGAVAARRHRPGTDSAGAGCPQPRDRRLLHRRGPGPAAT